MRFNPTDRDFFILYYLRKGLIEKFTTLGEEAPLEPKYSQKFSHLTEPRNFSLNLLEWTRKEFNMEDYDVVEVVERQKVCLDSGKCVDIRDVGSNCCLF